MWRHGGAAPRHTAVMAHAEEHHGHAHDGEHAHAGDGHEHGHEHGRLGWRDRLRQPLGHGHSHDPGEVADQQLEASDRGQRALLISVLGLGLTAVLQALVVWRSGSVALLGDTLHNLADALTAVPLAVAFRLGRRAANRRYTYGYGRAEDLAGIAIVVFILASAALAASEAVERLRHPADVRYLGVVAGAALVGFAGNELVAVYRIRVGRAIGSAALVADGLHARTDGFTSLAVVGGALGVLAGWEAADPVVGLLITVAILFVLRSAAKDIYRRLMDAVDPELVDAAEASLRSTPGVRAVEEVRLRWIGHRVRAEVGLVVDADLGLVEAHHVATEAHHRLLHDVKGVDDVTVHVSPSSDGDEDHHAALAHHRRSPRA